MRGNSLFHFHCRNPCNSGRHKSIPAALSNRLGFFFSPCSDITHLLLSSVPANLNIKKFTSICKSCIILYHIIYFVRAHSEGFTHCHRKVSGFKQLVLSLFSELKSGLQHDVKKFCSLSNDDAQLWSGTLSQLFLQPSEIRTANPITEIINFYRHLPNRTRRCEPPALSVPTHTSTRADPRKQHPTAGVSIQPHHLSYRE